MLLYILFNLVIICLGVVFVGKVNKRFLVFFFNEDFIVCIIMFVE